MGWPSIAVPLGLAHSPIINQNTIIAYRKLSENKGGKKDETKHFRTIKNS